MTRREFENLRDIVGKVIEGDIQYTAPGECSPLLIFDNIHVQNSLGYDIRLNGKFNPLLPSIVFNFRILDVGPICRVEVNSTVHNGTRTHKHSLWEEEDPRRNLPSNVIARPDLEGLTAKKVWDKLCIEAKITHKGVFEEPENRRVGA